MKTMTETKARLPQSGEGAMLVGVCSGKFTVDLEVVMAGEQGSSKTAARMRKIMDLRRALEQGSYVVDCEMLADALLRRAGRCGEEAGPRYSA